MKIEVKNIKMGPNSQETYNFKADIYVNDENVGYAYNHGHGGSTFVGPNDGPSKVLYDEAEKHLGTIIDVKGSETFEKTKYYDMESYVDEKIDEYDEQQFIKKTVNRNQKNNILWGNPKGQIYKISWKGSSIQDMKHGDPRNRQTLISRIKKILSELKPGEVILNTNLDEEIKIAKNMK